MWYAHSPGESDPNVWQPLEDHLEHVASLAARFAEEIGAEHWGEVAGLLHDLGKASDAFQARLHGSQKSFDHSIAGAAYAQGAFEAYNGPLGKIATGMLPYVIAGHHGGIPNGTVQAEGDRLRPLNDRLSDWGAVAVQPEALERMGLELPGAEQLEQTPIERILGDLPAGEPERSQALSCALFCLSVHIRMLYSCLVDADYLDTEQFMTPDIAETRARPARKSLRELSDALDTYLDRLTANAPDTVVNRARASILEDCRVASCFLSGIFTLTVPTGGGKTLSVMSFALRHALTQGQKHVIYASPFTSITEQTAGVFRSVFGEENVLEHHSNFDTERLDEERLLSHRLAVQNWDAPIVVTTNVQLLESLFSNKPGKCRKVHSIANSVIILDEAQTLPDGLLLPTLAMLETLSRAYGVTVVLCTATQPALDALWPFGAQPREIVQNRKEFPAAFDTRVTFEHIGEIDEMRLAERIAGEHQALCIVGTKAKARNLYNDVAAMSVQGGAEDDGAWEPRHVFHLSANMTPLHRAFVLDRVRELLKKDERCLVISTQLIEAGVDIDFPCVFREMAGVDSMLQAAGRCNREGARSVGRVYIFELAGEGADSGGGSARTWLGRMKSIGRAALEKRHGIFDDELVSLFFRERFSDRGLLDAKGIYRDLTDRHIMRSGLRTLQLERVARSYRIIDDAGRSVFVPWGEEGWNLMARLQETRRTGMSPATMVVPLQRSSINVRADVYDRLKSSGLIDDVTYEPIAVLKFEERCCLYYSDDMGLLMPGEEVQNDLII